MDKNQQVYKWISAEDTYEQFASIDLSDGFVFDGEKWFEDLCEKSGKTVYDAKTALKQLTALYAEVYAYQTALEAFRENDLYDSLLKIFDVTVDGFKLKYSKSFSDTCREMLGILYDLGIESEKDVYKALDIIKINFQFDHKDMVYNPTRLQKVIDGLTADLTDCIAQMKNYRMIKDAFHSPNF